MAFLRVLEGLRTPVLDEIMALLTHLGSESVFLVAALFVFWCVNKREGYYLMTVGFCGTIINQFCKLWFRIPRPWVLDPDFTIVEAARADATGYSFPSGHTQSAVGTFGSLACMTKNRLFRVLCVLLAVVVPFTRMYLGVHTPLDVGVAAATALLLVFGIRPLFREEHNKKHSGKLYGLLFVLVTFSVLFVLFVELYPFPADIDPHNLESGIKNAWTLLGSTLGVLLAYWLDDEYIGFETEAVWWAQALKLILGAAFVLAVKTFLKAPLMTLLNGHGAAHAIRYFAVVVVAGAIWPISFSLFSHMGERRR